MAISTFVQRLAFRHTYQRHTKAVKRNERDLDHVSVVLEESLPVVLEESLPVVVATLLPGVSQGVSMIRSKRICFISTHVFHHHTGPVSTLERIEVVG